MRNFNPFKLGAEREKEVLVALHFLRAFCTFSNALPEGEDSLPVLCLLLYRVHETEGSPGWKTEAENCCCFPTVVHTPAIGLTLWSEL